MRHTGLVVGVIMAVSASFWAVGCAGDPNADLPQLTTPRTVSAGWITAEGGAPAEMTVRSVDYRLSGPHYSLGIAWVATGVALDGHDAGTLAISPVRAAQREQLTVAAVDGGFTAAAFAPSGPIQVFAVVDGKATPLRELPLAATQYGAPADKTQLIEIGAPVTASVRLRIIDANQTDELDLRTGSTTGTAYHQTQADAVWQGRSSAVLTTNDPRTAQAVGLELATPPPTSVADATSLTHAELENYQEGIGWAQSGTEFLTVPLPAIDMTCPRETEYACIGYEDHFDDSTALSFTPEGGSPIPARAAAQSVKIGLPDLHSLGYAVFPVPAGTTRGTITLTLAGSQLFDDGTAEGTWTTAPQPFTLPVNLG